MNVLLYSWDTQQQPCIMKRDRLQLQWPNTNWDIGLVFFVGAVHHSNQQIHQEPNKKETSTFRKERANITLTSFSKCSHYHKIRICVYAPSCRTLSIMYAEPLFSSMPLPLFQSPNRRSFPKAATRCTPGPGYRPKPQQQTWLTCHRSRVLRVLVGARAPTISHYEEFQVVTL